MSIVNYVKENGRLPEKVCQEIDILGNAFKDADDPVFQTERMKIIVEKPWWRGINNTRMFVDVTGVLHVADDRADMVFDFGPDDKSRIHFVVMCHEAYHSWQFQHQGATRSAVEWAKTVLRSLIGKGRFYDHLSSPYEKQAMKFESFCLHAMQPFNPVWRDASKRMTS